MAQRAGTLTAPAAPTRGGRPRGLPSPKALGPLAPRLRPYTGRLAFAGLLILCAAAIGLAFPLVAKRLLDAAFVLKHESTLNHIALALLGLFILQGVMNAVQVTIVTATAERIMAQLRAELYAHLVRLAPAFFTERRTGELTSRLSADVTMLQSVMTYQVSELARQVLFLIGGIILLSITHPALTLTTLAVVPVVVGAALIFGRALRRASTGVQDRLAGAMATAEETFGQIRTVQGFTREAAETRRFDELMGDVIAAALRRARIRGTFFGVITTVAFGGIVAVLWQGGRLVLAGQLTAGALVEFLLYAVYVAAAVGQLASLFGSYQEAIGAARRVFELLEIGTTVPEPEHPVPLPRPVQGDVRLDQVRFAYAPDLPEVLHDVSLHIAPGEVVALVGPSGAGKTTIASLVPRFWDVTAGRITLDGIDVRELAFVDLRGAIGTVPQEPALFSGTIRENIAFARPDASEGEIVAAARAAHAWEFIERLPEGLDTVVGERGVKLSGGQRQRLAIARVFLKNPAVVILDEATSSLDTESERLVEAAMETLLHGRSTLIIAHRLSTVRRADRVVVLDGGQVIEEGTHDALLEEGGVYARLWRGQFRREPTPEGERASVG